MFQNPDLEGHVTGGQDQNTDSVETPTHKEQQINTTACPYPGQTDNAPYFKRVRTCPELKDRSVGHVTLNYFSGKTCCSTYKCRLCRQ